MLARSVRLGALSATLMLAVLNAAPVSAEVVSKSDDGFVLHFSKTIKATPGEVVTALGQLDRWWDGAHSYSGDAANLSLALEPGGCWCEQLPDGTTFEHGRVVSVAPDRVVLNAPLGPLHDKTTRAEMTLSIAPQWESARVTLDFVVDGEGLGIVSEGVDGVLGNAFDRLSLYAETGSPTPQP